MKNKRGFRKGDIGLAQIMAMLLVVLPTMAFIIALLTDYWAVMQADYKLKLIANSVSEVADNKQNLSGFTTSDNGLCPKGSTLSFSNPSFYSDANKTGFIDVTIRYLYNGTYFKNKMLTTTMHTYSYHDQNMSIVGTCQ